jgi:hypothetical protein
MIQAAAQMRILVAVEAVDFRCGIDGLARLCKQQLKSDPFCGPFVCLSQPAQHGHQDFGL